MNRISRTAFLTMLIGATPPQEHLSNMSSAGLKPYSGNWNEAQLLHLIRRSLFGVSQADFNFFSGKTLNECLTILFKQSPEPIPPLNTYNDDAYHDPDVPFGKTWVHSGFGNPDGLADFKRVKSLKSWWIGQLLNQDHSITEKMTLFWSNHLAAQASLMKDARLDYSYAALLRTYSLGNFKQLIRAMTLNPGMLEYLNGITNTAAAPNENYSRELQELFTIGKGSDSHYTEEDVKQAARVLTGWNTKDTKNGVDTFFNPDIHDVGDKQFSTFYNNTVIKGKKGMAGSTETDELIDMLFKQHEVAKFVCRNLYRWFVYYDINKQVEEQVIEPLADIFISNNFEIKPVLQSLLGSEHFFDPAIRGCLIKNPVDHLIGACRQFGLADFPTDLVMQYKAWNQLEYYLFLIGMDLEDPPNVAGWNATYQFPSFHEIWINSTTLAFRNSSTDALLSQNGLAGPDVSIHLDLLGFTKQLPDAADINRLIADSTKLLCPMPFGETEIDYLKTILLSGQTSDYYWTDAWKAYLAQPQDDVSKSVVLNRLRSFYTYILQRSEYQLS